MIEGTLPSLVRVALIINLQVKRNGLEKESRDKMLNADNYRRRFENKMEVWG